ncbi:MAG TPA: FecR domain-containing protein [Chryseolinea sp.]|nr:FecR domain-containing protein [Chryseolinea sp.]
MDYSKHQVEDFVTDAFFIKWVKSPTDEHNAFWNAWLSKHNESRKIVEEARQIILLLDIKEHVPPDGKFLEIWERIGREDQSAVDRDAGNELTLVVRPPIKWFYKLAASLLLLICVGGFYWSYSHRTVVVVTAYGESRTLILPDSTKVMLNSNSSIRYNTGDFTDSKREIWLNGEAFFAVVRKTNEQHFLVHTGQLHVEVLGTKFNVNSRRGKTRVVLQEGKVKLDLESKNKPPLYMRPGDMVEFSEKDKTPVKKTVDTNNYLAWRNNRLIFSSTSLLEIAQLLEDNYGYKVVFEEEEIANRKFTGSSPSDNLQELFQKLSIVFDLTIQQDMNILTIQYNKENPKQRSRS